MDYPPFRVSLTPSQSLGQTSSRSLAMMLWVSMAALVLFNSRSQAADENVLPLVEKVMHQMRSDMTSSIHFSRFETVRDAMTTERGILFRPPNQNATKLYIREIVEFGVWGTLTLTAAERSKDTFFQQWRSSIDYSLDEHLVKSWGSEEIYTFPTWGKSGESHWLMFGIHRDTGRILFPRVFQANPKRYPNEDRHRPSYMISQFAKLQECKDEIRLANLARYDGFYRLISDRPGTQIIGIETNLRGAQLEQLNDKYEIIHRYSLHTEDANTTGSDTQYVPLVGEAGETRVFRFQRDRVDGKRGNCVLLSRTVIPEVEFNGKRYPTQENRDSLWFNLTPGELDRFHAGLPIEDPAEVAEKERMALARRARDERILMAGGAVFALWTAHVAKELPGEMKRIMAEIGESGDLLPTTRPETTRKPGDLRISGYVHRGDDSNDRIPGAVVSVINMDQVLGGVAAPHDIADAMGFFTIDVPADRFKNDRIRLEVVIDGKTILGTPQRLDGHLRVSLSVR